MSESMPTEKRGNEEIAIRILNNYSSIAYQYPSLIVAIKEALDKKDAEYKEKLSLTVYALDQFEKAGVVYVEKISELKAENKRLKKYFSGNPKEWGASTQNLQEAQIEELKAENRELSENIESYEKQDVHMFELGVKLSAQKEEIKRLKKESDFFNLKVSDYKEALKLAVEALEAQRVFWPLIKTRDMGTCKICGASTSSGMDHTCKKCAFELAKTALERIREIGGE